ncbi:hypothetical protein N7467_001595 [Penicillium canescens]|nr:hypothetical protein N7467_001595 [Penicillium canescens]
MDPAEYANRWNLAKDLHIKFLGPVQPSQWPSTHERLFSDVQKLGKRTFDWFTESITIDTLEKPWRNAIRNRAMRLSKLAEEILNAANDFGSRRFLQQQTVSIGRRTHSKLDVASASLADVLEFGDKISMNHSSQMLPLVINLGASDDGGINMLFSDQVGATIKHYPALAVAAQPGRLKKYEAPDRVYGLKQTDNFKILLDSTDRRSLVASTRRSLRESIEFTPFGPEGEPLLYPFLIMEAKASNGASRAEVDMQTAFCIKRLLKLQHGLRTATGDDTQWLTGTAETQQGVDMTSEIHYTIVDLWNGNISNLDQSLQLLLIVDYIFDWARDIYRPAILGELDVLATGDITATDPGVFSTMSSRIASWMNASTEGQTTQVSTFGEPPDLNYLKVVSQEGVIRDAHVIESRHVGLKITEDDVDTFLLSFPCAKAAEIWLFNMLKCLSGSWRVNADTIDALESFWTAEPRPTRDKFRREEMFYLNIAIHMFVSELWEPIRQITCFSIAESALQLIFSKLGHIQHPDFTQHPEVDPTRLDNESHKIRICESHVFNAHKPSSNGEKRSKCGPNFLP